jgi:hypothetical protein
MRHRCPPLHIAKLSRNAKLVRFRSMADFEQASPRSIWLKLPNSRAQRLAAMGFFAHGAQIMASNPKIAARRPQSNRLFKMPACRIHQPQGFDWRSRRLKYLAENSAVKTYLIPERTKLLSNHRRHAALASGAAKR